MGKMKRLIIYQIFLPLIVCIDTSDTNVNNNVTTSTEIQLKKQVDYLISTNEEYKNLISKLKSQQVILPEVHEKVKKKLKTVNEYVTKIKSVKKYLKAEIETHKDKVSKLKDQFSIEKEKNLERTIIIKDL